MINTLASFFSFYSMSAAAAVGLVMVIIMSSSKFSDGKKFAAQGILSVMILYIGVGLGVGMAAQRKAEQAVKTTDELTQEIILLEQARDALRECEAVYKAQQPKE